ncbi:hypothetical protein D5S17_36015 [Pseudonocardiaceae bacterium YIM PH 21723]|nr:hypothetical protein D5S17_36015 [Pseudonocardiaceae bacterium YIM PH 21723]
MVMSRLDDAVRSTSAFPAGAQLLLAACFAIYLRHIPGGAELTASSAHPECTDITLLAYDAATRAIRVCASEGTGSEVRP